VRVLQIQGLRALAALLVVVFHAKFAPGGFIGVDIFYVISGYLITGLILREIESTGSLNLTSFYQRRIKRLLPTSIFVLFVTAAVGVFVLPDISRQALGRDLVAAATYVSNYLFAWWQNDYQNLNATPSPFIHYWSLAVEEQFYLVWPIFVLLLSRFGKRSIFIGIATATSLSLLLSIVQTQTSPIWAFYSLPTRAWELGIGALLLFVPTHFWKYRFIPWLGMLGIFVSTVRFDEHTNFPGINALLPVTSSALLIGSIAVWPRAFNDLSNNRISQWLGNISYPLYLWHWPALVLPSSALGRPLRVYERMLCILLTVVLAHFTSKYLEQPIRHKKVSGKKIYWSLIAATLISLVTGLLISKSVASTIQIQGTSYTFNRIEVLKKPDIYNDGCHLSYGKNVSKKCAYGDQKSNMVIVLYGDSHAAQWFPVIAKIAHERGLKLISLTKSSCPAVDVQMADKGAFKNIDCQKWRSNSIKRIQSIRPLAVITSSFQYYETPNGVSNRPQWWSDGQNRLLDELRGTSDHMIYISDTPHPLRDIPNCLASKGKIACDTTKKTSVTVIRGFATIDPTPWLCSTVCPAFQNGYVVYRDASHISVAAALALKPQLEASFQARGLFS